MCSMIGRTENYDAPMVVENGVTTRAWVGEQNHAFMKGIHTNHVSCRKMRSGRCGQRWDARGVGGRY